MSEPETEHLSTILQRDPRAHQQAGFRGLVEFVESMEPSHRVEELSALGVAGVPKNVIDQLLQVLSERANESQNWIMLGDIIESKYGGDSSYYASISRETFGSKSQRIEALDNFYADRDDQLNRAKEYYLKAGDLIGASVAVSELAWQSYGNKNYEMAIQQIDEAINLYQKGRESPKRDPNLGMSVSVRLVYHGVLDRLKNHKLAFEAAERAAHGP